MYGLSNVFATFVIACKELKIAEIAHINQLSQLLNLISAYGDAFFGLTHMPISKNVNHEISKHWPLFYTVLRFLISVIYPFRFLSMLEEEVYGGNSPIWDDDFTVPQSLSLGASRITPLTPLSERGDSLVATAR